MNAINSPESISTTSLINRQINKYSLEQPFYCNDDIFRQDIEHVLKKKWLLVDHASRIPKPGDFFLFEVAGESILIIRQDSKVINAFYNVCRHRGSRVCTKQEGSTRLITCPYHAWAYNLDGSLRSARLMPEDFDPTNFGLKKCHLKCYQGLIFISLNDNVAPEFNEEFFDFRALLELQGLEKSKVAHRESYFVAANWKLCVENFLECYHCQPSHPEYCQIHPKSQIMAFGAGPGSGSDEYIRAYQKELDAWELRAKELGHPTGFPVSDDVNSENFRQAGRLPISTGFLTETKDGTPASILMGEFSDFDGGETICVFNPFGYLHGMNDYTVLFRFTPRESMLTEIELIFLVNKNAKDNEVDVEKMKWMWEATVIQDKKITEDNQLGVLSRQYEPDPYSTHEVRTADFIKWYLKQLASMSE